MLCHCITSNVVSASAVPDTTVPVRFGSFSMISDFFASVPRFNTSYFSLPAAFRRGYGEAHRVGAVLLVGLHVPGFFLHYNTPWVAATLALFPCVDSTIGAFFPREIGGSLNLM